MAWRKQIRRKTYQIPDTTNSNSIINLGLKIERDTRDQRRHIPISILNIQSDAIRKLCKQ